MTSSPLSLPSGRQGTEEQPALPHFVRILTVSFDLSLKRWELVHFRGAVSRLAGPGHVLFHHHTEEGFVHRYPLIQYRFIGSYPSIIALKEGIEEIPLFFANLGTSIRIRGEERPIKVHRISPRRWTLQVWDHFFRYRIIRWLPLNPPNYEAYRAATTTKERRAILEKVMVGNILSMAKGLDWHVPREIMVRIHHFEELGPVKFKAQLPYLSFNAVFSTNVSIPYHVGLGKGSSLGYGGVFRASKPAE